jgi:cytochrome c-type biogenesis protein CcmH/NrfG
VRRSRPAALIASLLLASAFACSGPPKEVEEPEEPAADPQQLLSQGIAAEGEGKYDVAEKSYRESIRLKPADYEANSRLVGLLIKRGQAADALEAAKAFAAANPDDLRGLHLLADANLSSGNYEDAAAAMSKLLELDDDATAYEKRARARVLGQDLRGGEEDYRKALELQPDDLEYMVGLGSVLIRRGAPSQARELLAKALEIDEEHPRANVLIGIIYRTEMELDQALKHHLRAARVAPQNGRAHF